MTEASLPPASAIRLAFTSSFQENVTHMPEEPVWKHTIALLSGGGSRRMGEPKQDMTGPDGRTMLEMAIDTARGVGDRIVVSGPSDAGSDLPVVADERVDSGPLAGIEAVLKSGIDDCYLFMPCDMPGLTIDILKRLVNGLGRSQAAVLMHPGTGTRANLPLVLGQSSLMPLEETLESGIRSIHRFLDELDVAEIHLEADDEKKLVNINNPSDWRSYVESMIR